MDKEHINHLQPRTRAAIATRIIDCGMNVQDAIEAPRWLHGRTWGASSNDLKMEGRIHDTVLNDLIERGHPVNKLEDDTDTMGHAGADPRGNGAAVGY